MRERQSDCRRERESVSPRDGVVFRCERERDEKKKSNREEKSVVRERYKREREIVGERGREICRVTEEKSVAREREESERIPMEKERER